MVPLDPLKILLVCCFSYRWWNFLENDKALFRLYPLVLSKEQNVITHQTIILTAKNESLKIWCYYSFSCRVGLLSTNGGQASSQNTRPLGGASTTVGNIVALWAAIREQGRLRGRGERWNQGLITALCVFAPSSIAGCRKHRASHETLTHILANLRSWESLPLAPSIQLIPCTLLLNPRHHLFLNAHGSWEVPHSLVLSLSVCLV